MYSFYKCAIKEGRLDDIKNKFESSFDGNSFVYLKTSIKYNKLDCVEYLADKLYYSPDIFKRELLKPCSKRENIINYCCFIGNIEALKILLYKGYTLTIAALEKASYKGNVECIKYIQDLNVIDIKYNTSISNKSSMSLNLNCVKYCLDNFRWNSNLCEKAAYKGFLSCLRYICENYPIYKDYYFNSYKIILKACMKGHLECIKYVHKIHLKYNKTSLLWDIRTINLCAKKGNLECLKYLHENGCEWDIKTTYYLNGNLECLKYLHENGCEWDVKTTYYLNGNLECLKYLHENGCEWDETTITMFLLAGNFDCVDYCYKNGCKWDKNNLSYCISSLNRKGIEYSLKIPCEIDYDNLIDVLYQEHIQPLFYIDVNTDLVVLIKTIDVNKYPKISLILENIDYYLSSL
jgi:hypothetical protein